MIGIAADFIYPCRLFSNHLFIFPTKYIFFFQKICIGRINFTNSLKIFECNSQIWCRKHEAKLDG